MATLTHRIPHELSEEQVRATLDDAMDYYGERFARYHPRLVWRGPKEARLKLTAPLGRVSFTLRLHPRLLEVRAKVPLPLLLFKAQAVALVDKTVRQWIEQGRPEDVG